MKRNPYIIFVYVAIAVIAILMIIASITQIVHIAQRNDLRFLLDTLFGVFSVCFSLMVSASFLISTKGIKDPEKKTSFRKSLIYRRCIMLSGLFMCAISYVDVRGARNNTLHLILSISIIVIATVFCVFIMQKSIDEAEALNETKD